MLRQQDRSETQPVKLIHFVGGPVPPKCSGWLQSSSTLPDAHPSTRTTTLPCMSTTTKTPRCRRLLTAILHISSAIQGASISCTTYHVVFLRNMLKIVYSVEQSTTILEPARRPRVLRQASLALFCTSVDNTSNRHTTGARVSHSTPFPCQAHRTNILLVPQAHKRLLTPRQFRAVWALAWNRIYIKHRQLHGERGSTTRHQLTSHSFEQWSWSVCVQCESPCASAWTLSTSSTTRCLRFATCSSALVLFVSCRPG